MDCAQKKDLMNSLCSTHAKKALVWFSAATANIADTQVLLLFVSWRQNSSQGVIRPPMGSLSG